MTDNLPPPAAFDVAAARSYSKKYAASDLRTAAAARFAYWLDDACDEIESLSARLASATEEREKWESRANAYEHESNKHLDLIDRVSQLEGALREAQSEAEKQRRRFAPLGGATYMLHVGRYEAFTEALSALSAPNHPSEQPDAPMSTDFPDQPRGRGDTITVIQPDPPEATPEERG